jgi:hypothetical protein
MSAVTPSRDALTYLPICAPCVRGEGSECHTPGCALFLRDVPTDGLIAEFALDLDTLADDEALQQGSVAEAIWLHRSFGVDRDDYTAVCGCGRKFVTAVERQRHAAQETLRALAAALSERGDR